MMKRASDELVIATKAVLPDREAPWVALPGWDLAVVKNEMRRGLVTLASRRTGDRWYLYRIPLKQTVPPPLWQAPPSADLLPLVRKPRRRSLAPA